MSWAAFHVVEVMSSSKFQFKRIGYLGASQSFTPTTPFLMLCTNLFKKDFTSKEVYESSLALSVLSNVCTPDLARDLVADVSSMLNSSRYGIFIERVNPGHISASVQPSAYTR